MFENRREIMQDVFLTYLPAQHFKTSRLTLNLVTGLDRASASANALLPAVLRRGTVRCPDMESLSAALDTLYGANIDYTVRKKGERQCVGFAAGFIDDGFTPHGERLLEPVAQQLGLDEYHAGLLPGDKVDQIEKLLAEKQPKENLAFVGDGINDAPVLSRADVGIAMGALGSDAAIEAADVVLMDDDPAKIALAMRIARRTLRIVHQNIVFALGIKALCLLLGALGIAGMWAAIFADVGVMVIAVLNATRALYTKDLTKN